MAPRDKAVDRPGLPDDSKVSAADAAASEQLTYHPLGGIDPDDACPRVNQGAAGVARVQRNVSLNDVLDQLPRGTSQGSTKGADHPADSARRLCRGAHGSPSSPQPLPRYDMRSA
jgi:hypothetical protein